MINCKKCGAVIPDSLNACLICGAKSGELPPHAYNTGDFAPDSAPAARTAIKRHPKMMSRVIVITGIILALTAAATFAAQIFPYYFGAPGIYRAKNAAIYTVGGSLKFMSPSMDVPEILADEIGQLGGIDAKASSNGKYIAYIRRLSGTAKLYLRDFSARPTVTQPETADIEISPDAQSFFFTDGNTQIIYLTRNGELYSYDFTHSRLIGENIREVVGHNDEYVLCIGKGNDDSGAHASALYVIRYLPGENTRQAVAEDVYELIDHTAAFDKFIFTVWQGDGDNGVISDIVAVDIKQNTRQTLATGAGKIIAADAKNFTVLYQTAYNNPLHYDNIINDDLAREDDKVKEPDLDDYPLLKEFYEKYGVDADYSGTMEFEDIAEEDAKLDIAIAAYDKSRDNEKLRFKILDGLDEFIVEFPTLYDLYLYHNGNVRRISESSYSPFDDAKLDVLNGVASWRETNFNTLEKTLFSRLPADTDIFRLLSERLTDKLYIQPFGQSSVQIGIGGKDKSFTCGGWQLAGKADGVFFAMREGAPPISERNRSLVTNYPPYDYNLYYYYSGTNKDIYGHIFVMDKNVGTVGEMLDGDRLLYFKDISGNICDLYMLDGTRTDSAGQRIGENVSLLGDYFKLANNGKTLLFCERFNEKTNSGNLFMYTNQNRQLATDVNDIYYKNDSLVYFIRNLENGKADLYLFGESGPVLLDTGVTAVADGSPFMRVHQGRGGSRDR